MKLIDHHRNNQNKFRGEFVSVMDLVNYLATDADVSTGDAAAALLSLFEKSEATDRPRYGSADEIDNSFIEMEKIQGVEHLDDILDVSVGMKPGRFADVADHFGWIREELFDFFKSKEIEPPICLPDWKGSGYPVAENKEGQDDGLQAVQNGSQAQTATSNDFYTTPLLDLQKAVIEKFYSQPRVVDPKKETVLLEIFDTAKKLGIDLSDNVAEAMFTIIKPKDHNPKKRRG